MPEAPRVYDKPAIIAALCEFLVEGGTVLEFLEREGMPSKTTIYDWMDYDPEAKKLFERAQDIGNRVLLDMYKVNAFNTEEGERSETETVKLTAKAGKGQDDVELPAEKVKTFREDMLGHRKHKGEAILKLLARRDPAKYGARVDVRADVKHAGKLSFEQLVREAAKDPEPQGEGNGDTGDGTGSGSG